MARLKYNHTKESKKKIGLKASKYSGVFANQAFIVCRDMGATNEQLAELFNVSTITIHNWKHTYPEFINAVKEGRYAFDTKKVERACLDRALGYEYEEVRTEQITIKSGKGKKRVGIPGIKKTITTKKIQPDPTLIMFWLQNRQPETWKNVQRQLIETTNKTEHTVKHDFSNLRREDLEQLRDLVARTGNKAEDTISGGSGLGAGISVSETLYNSELAISGEG